MKFQFYTAILFLFITLSACSIGKRDAVSKNSSRPEEKQGWKLGSQAYTFKNFTFFEAVDKIDSCNLGYVEAYPGQTLGGGLPGKMDYKMAPEIRDQILAKLKEKGVKMEAFGVASPREEADWRQLFEFAKAMGIKTITSEPVEKDLPLISALCDEYEINLAIHNHPKPSHYWDPDVVLAALKGQSKRIGACADIGHWIRSGLDPIESLKKLEGHVIHSHMKDLNEKNVRAAHDVIWGNGVSNIEGVINELKRQDFKGMISVEYEHNWFHSAPEVAASVAYFRSVLQK